MFVVLAAITSAILALLLLMLAMAAAMLFQQEKQSLHRNFAVLFGVASLVFAAICGAMITLAGAA